MSSCLSVLSSKFCVLSIGEAVTLAGLSHLGGASRHLGRSPLRTEGPFNLDSSFGFSRRAAEVAGFAEKVSKTEAFRSPNAHCYDRTDVRPNAESPSCSGVPIFFLNGNHGIRGPHGTDR